jgi:hypothetical protein
MTNKFRHHEYTWSKPWGSPHHKWVVVGPEGGLHFHVSLTPKYDPSCGLEFHHNRAAWMRIVGRSEAPHHLQCQVIGEPCWHDGTSMYAREHLWPICEPMLKEGAHDMIFRVLESEYESHFERNVEDAS